jgi:hypothetical protein
MMRMMQCNESYDLSPKKIVLMGSVTFKNMDINWNVCCSNADSTYWCDENLSILCEILYCFMLCDNLFVYFHIT